MKFFALFTLFFVVAATALDDMTFNNTYVDSAVLTPDQLNEDNDTTRLPFNRLNDSLDTKFVRFTDVRDSTFQRINCDTIRGTPDVDSFKGNPRIDSVDVGLANLDSVRGAPDIDSIQGEPGFDSLRAIAADITTISGDVGNITTIAAPNRVTTDQLVCTTGYVRERIRFTNPGVVFSRPYMEVDTTPYDQSIDTYISDNLIGFNRVFELDSDTAKFRGAVVANDSLIDNNVIPQDILVVDREVRRNGSAFHVLGASGDSADSTVSTNTGTAASKIGTIRVRINGVIRYLRLYDSHN